MVERKNYNKQAFSEGKCPACGSDDISEITGWCYNHHNPELNGDSLPFCDTDKGDCAIVSKIENAFMCNDCDTMFDNKKMENWDWQPEGFGNCPVGKEVPESPDEYADQLYLFIRKYDENEVNECMNQGHYLEAIGTIFIQISEQLRFLMVKRIKEHESIPLDPVNLKYKSVLKQIKKMNDYQLYEFAFIFGRISKKEYAQLEALRKLRNKFSHSFEEREQYEDEHIKQIIDDSKPIEKRLRELVENNGPPLINP